MNKGEIVKAVARRKGITISTAHDVVEDFFDVAKTSLAVGEEVTVRGFGRFELRDRPPVTLKNPRTGDPILVPPRQTVVFLPSMTLKARLNGDT